MKLKKYAVFFEEFGKNATKDNKIPLNPELIKGFYSKKQPYYNWSFTDDINQAKLWKTKKGAQAKIEHQKTCCYRNLVGKIIEVEVNESLTIK